MRKLLPLVVIALFCSAGVVAADEHDAQIREASKGWAAAFNAGDTKALSEFYAADALLMPPQADFVKGRDAIVEFWTGVVAGVDGTLDMKEVQVHGNFAYVIGAYELVDEAGTVVDRGKYIEIWNRQKGSWKIYRDIWNTSLPAAEPEE